MRIGEFEVVFGRDAIMVGCTRVDKKTIEKVLSKMKSSKAFKPKFKRGDRIKVIATIGDSKEVLGREGFVATPDSIESLSAVMCRFSEFEGGHNGDLDDYSRRDHWSVDQSALKLIKRKK